METKWMLHEWCFVHWKGYTMGYTIAQKIIKAHLLSGEMTVGSDIGLKIDQTLTQDATGTMAYL